MRVQLAGLLLGVAVGVIAGAYIAWHEIDRAIRHALERLDGPSS